MEKTFTISVPDELWVNSWNTNKTETYTYTGPSAIKVMVETVGDWEYLEWSESEFERELNDHELIIELAVTDETVAVAHWITTISANYEYTYVETVNHDNSTYNAIANPRIQDYFTISYRPNSGFSLDPIYKETKNLNADLAEERKAYVKKYDDLYDFDTAIQEKIDTFLQVVDTYLENMQTAYPWKYVTIDKNEVPKIPASLILEFQKLPAIN